MFKGIRLLVLFLLISIFSFSQNNENTANDSITSIANSSNSTSTTSTQPEESQKKEFIFKPTLGLGTGMLSFYGDIYENHFQIPMVSRIGYELSLGQQLTDYLQLNFYALFGKLGANERLTANNRNLNFQSQINAGGAQLLYNFGNFLPKKRTASPYISLGIESFEFLSKTDAYDQYGNKYYYWADGSTRNIAENSANASDAIIIHRDYKYESDVREMNLDGFGKYPERSFAIPIGVGAIFNINDFLTFKLGATMHFTFTDYIDGVTSKSTGNRTGNSKNDNFMMTSFSLNYNFGTKKNDPKYNHEEEYEGVDFLALENGDEDNDGVLDLKDSCLGTPSGVPVDTKGCPLDDDMDGVPNYKDNELTTPVGAFVDEKGVQLSDSLLAYQYEFYMDSTGKFAKVEIHDHTGGSKGSKSIMNQKEYTVLIGTFNKGLPPELMTKFLSISDITSSNVNDSTTIYTAGKFNNLLEAENRKKQLVGDGLAHAKVVYKQNGIYFDAPVLGTTTNSTSLSNTNTTNTTSVVGNNTTAKDPKISKNTTSFVPDNTDMVLNTPGMVLRIQLGAYKKRMSKSVYKNVPDVIEIKTDDGLYKYLSGSFTNFDAAAKHKVDLVLKGYEGAFIAAYKDGKRISLKDAGATSKKEEQTDLTDTSSTNGANKNLIVFKVQVGVFKSDPPDAKMSIFAKIDGISGETTQTGLKRYIVGSFKDYKSAEEYKNDIIKKYALNDAFVVAYYNNEFISLQEAFELMK